MSEGHWLGIDVGWVFPAADSDGQVYEWTKRRRPQEQIAQAGPLTIRRPNGTVVVREPLTPKQAADAEARAARSWAYRALAQQVVGKASRSERGLALENWSSFQRRKSAWIKVYEVIVTHAHDKGVEVVEVNRAYTSITCPACSRKSRDSRVTRDRFECVFCGFAGHADVIAAMNIAKRAEGRFVIDTGPCKNPACPDRAAVNRRGYCDFCYHFRRVHNYLPSKEDRERRDADFTVYLKEAQERNRQARNGRVNAELQNRQAMSYATHDPWGNPLDESQACN